METRANVLLKDRPQSLLEEQISEAERSLGIETECDRLREASLFVDRKFIKYALITGVAKKPERIFGNNAWADYLDGRNFASSYGDQDLTPNFINELHKKLTQRTNPEISGEIRSTGVKGGSYDDEQKPLTLAPEQVRAIDENQALSFRREPPEDKDGSTGFISYPHSGKAAEVQGAIEQDLKDICEWFNNAKNQDRYNPHIIAGLLQHRLISLHPFADGNGTLSRVLMNWSLENDGESPSALEDPSEDIFTDEETWIARVSEGSRYYADVKKRTADLKEAGINENTAVFGLGTDQAFYNYIFIHMKKAPPLPTTGDKHRHQVYEEFLAEFQTEMSRFQEFMSSTVNIYTPEGAKVATQGGLIAPDFRQYIFSPHASSASEELRSKFLSDVEVYRGGMIDGEVDDEKLCQMFMQVVGVGAGYRPLKRSNMPATSSQAVDSAVLRESFDYFNRMIADSYFKKKHPDETNPYSVSALPVKDFDTTVRDHVGGGSGIWDSPFVSTSTSYDVSRGFAKKFNAHYAKNADHGVLFKAYVPREGVIATSGGHKIGGQGIPQSGFGYEHEILLAGGIPPSAINGIEIYDRFDRNLSKGRLGLSAKRVEDDSGVRIVIEDHREEFVRIRTYTYSSDAERFIFGGEEVTTIPVVVSDEGHNYDWLQPKAKLDVNISNFVDNIKPKYKSPFGEHKYQKHKFQETILPTQIYENFIPENEHHSQIHPNEILLNKEYNIFEKKGSKQGAIIKKQLYHKKSMLHIHDDSKNENN